MFNTACTRRCMDSWCCCYVLVAATTSALLLPSIRCCCHLLFGDFHHQVSDGASDDDYVPGTPYLSLACGTLRVISMRVLKHQQQSSQTTVGCRTRFQKSLQMILVHRGAAVVDWVPASCTGVSPAGSQYRSARASRRSESRSCFLTDTEPLGVAVVGCGCDPVAATPFASRLLGERRSDDRRELYCCEGCIEVDVAADPRMEFFDPRDVGVWSALFCLLRSF